MDLSVMESITRLSEEIRNALNHSVMESFTLLREELRNALNQREELRNALNHRECNEQKNKLKHYEDNWKCRRQIASDVRPLYVDSGKGSSYASGFDPAAANNGSLTPKNTPHEPISLILDSGASLHVTGDHSLLTNLTPMPDGVQMSISGRHYITRKFIEQENKLKHYEDIRNGNRKMATVVHPLSVDSGAGLSYASGRDPAAGNNGTPTPKNTPHEPIWLIDSGSPFHATGDLSLLTNLTPMPNGDQTIRVPHKGQMQVHGIGSVNTPNVVLQNVRYVPDLGKINLISIGQLTKRGYKVSTGAYGCHISKGSDDNVVGKAHFTDDFQFQVEFVKVPPPPAN